MSAASHEKVRAADIEDAHTAPLPRPSGQLHHQVSQYSIQLSPEQYERLFLSNIQPKAGDARFRFANPTGLGLLAFAIAFTPVSFCLMRWGETSIASFSAFVPQFYALGGVCVLVAAIGEFILGNTITFIVFALFSGFGFEMAILFDPMHNVASAFPNGGADPAYNAGLAMHWSCWTVGVFLLFLASLKINITFAVAFLSLDICFALFAAAFFKTSEGASPQLVADLMQAAGAVLFITCVAIWWLTANTIFASTALPFALPVGDLSQNFSKRCAKLAAQAEARS